MKIIRKISHYDDMNNIPCITEIHDINLEESLLNIEWNPCLVSNVFPKTVFKNLKIEGFTFSNTSNNYIVPDYNISSSVLGTCITLKCKDIDILDSSKFIAWSKFIWEFQDLLPEAGDTVKYILEKKDPQKYDMLLLVTHNLKKAIKDCILDNLNYKEGQEWNRLVSTDQNISLNKFRCYGNPNTYSSIIYDSSSSVESRFFRKIATNDFIRNCVKEVELNIGVYPLNFIGLIDIDNFKQGLDNIAEIADKVHYRVTDYREYILPEDFTERILSNDYQFVKDFTSAPLKIVNPEYLVLPSGIETKYNGLLGIYITLLQGKPISTNCIKRAISDVETSILERLLEVYIMRKFKHSTLLPVNKSINFKILK